MLGKLTLVLVLLCATLAVQAEVTKVTASVDKNPVMVDEAFQLIITAEGKPDRNAFDSSALMTQFIVGRTSISTQTSMINFDTTHTTTWTTLLYPRAEGKFTIPAITIEGKQTKPIEINVVPVTQGSGNNARDYYVETAIDTQSVYLQQQFRYTVKLFLATNIERGSLQAPELNDAQIQQLGEDKQYTDIVNGKQYSVIERTFAIIPQRSGTFTIQGPVFSGEVIAANTRQSFGFFNRTRNITRVGPSIEVTVKAIPQGINDHWLPSEMVVINEEWPANQQLTVGEPLTRTITLTATGVVEEQLPEIAQNYPPNFKLYPDQPDTATVDRDGLLIAQRVESVAIIPTKAGDFVLPAVSVPWFNVMTEQMEVATLPARTITVQPASSAMTNSVTSAPAQASSQPQPALGDQQSNTTATIKTVEVTDPSLQYIIYGLSAALVICLVGWIATYVTMRKKAGLGSTKIAFPISADGGFGIGPHETALEAELYGALIKSLSNDHIGVTQNALRRWLECVQKQYSIASDSLYLGELDKVHASLNQALSSRYSNSNTTTNTEQLQQQIKVLRQYVLKKSSTNQPLAPLYS